MDQTTQAPQAREVMQRSWSTTSTLDPIDLVLLTSGWVETSELATSIGTAELLADTAVLLRRVWEEFFSDKGCSFVWAYEVAKPLGVWMAMHTGEYITSEAAAKATEREALKLIVEALTRGV